MQDLEKFFTRRLHGQRKLAIENFDLVLCNLHIAPRNILWLEDGSICFVNWELAGFFPRLFEVCRQRILNRHERDFNQLLLNSMRSLTDEEDAQADFICLAWYHIQKYY